MAAAPRELPKALLPLRPMLSPQKALEGLLSSHHVRWLVIPSIKGLQPMWQGKFRFVPFTIEEQKVGAPGLQQESANN